MVVGINGSYGFIGYHLWLYLNYKCDDIEVIRLSKNLDKDLENLSRCNIVVHMAEKNRGDIKDLYKNNILSATKLTDLLDDCNNPANIIYTSSTHEKDDNLFGQWRRDNNKMFTRWAENSNCSFKSLKLPNIFGPFCKPNYNSFIATFCDKVIKGEEIEVNDNKVSLLYVDNLCKQIYKTIINLEEKNIPIKYDTSIKVSDVYSTLLRFKEDYLNLKRIPNFENEFEINLFNTFRSYIDKDSRLFKVDSYNDERGRLSELVVAKTKGQIFFSTTKPKVVRGNHFHSRRVERFCILEGKALVQMRKIGTDTVLNYEINGTDSVVVDMPVYYTHNLKNIGDTNLICCFWMNDILKEEKIDDTYYEEV